MRIQAVFFDMGGTIETYGYTRALRLEATRELQARLQLAGIELPLDIEGLHTVISDGLQRYKTASIANLEELPPLQVWRDYVLVGYDLDPEKLGAIAEDLAFFVETNFYHREMRPEMPAVLAAIRGMGLKIGLISNVNSHGQVPVNLKKYGIDPYFDPIVLSSEYGRRKPDPAIFHYAARLANVPTSACLYVGDRIARDIVGARKAGYRLAVQIQHDFEHGEDDSGATPDFVIHDMTELVDILRADADQAAGERLPERPLQAVLFDAGDILYHRPDKGSAFRAFLEQLALVGQGQQASGKELLTRQAYRGEINQDQFREGMLRLYGVDQPELIERGKQALEEDDNSVEFLEGVQETLIALKERGYLLGIVTDTANPVHAKLRWFENGGIGHVWDSIISSKEVGTRKPDAQIYLAALQQLGTPPERAVFVGHKASELEGARAVGMQTIAFNYDADARADYFIESFYNLLTLPILS
jgi:HAD superfamily hydrolase (TIGR01549 family)/HAD superfamily hydrolase (TIGR01509 family)